MEGGPCAWRHLSRAGVSTLRNLILLFQQANREDGRRQECTLEDLQVKYVTLHGQHDSFQELESLDNVTLERLFAGVAWYDANNKRLSRLGKRNKNAQLLRQLMLNELAKRKHFPYDEIITVTKKARLHLNNKEVLELVQCWPDVCLEAEVEGHLGVIPFFSVEEDLGWFLNRYVKHFEKAVGCKGQQLDPVSKDFQKYFGYAIRNNTVAQTYGYLNLAEMVRMKFPHLVAHNWDIKPFNNKQLLPSPIYHLRLAVQQLVGSGHQEIYSETEIRLIFSSLSGYELKQGHIERLNHQNFASLVMSHAQDLCRVLIKHGVVFVTALVLTSKRKAAGDAADFGESSTTPCKHQKEEIGVNQDNNEAMAVSCSEDYLKDEVAKQDPEQGAMLHLHDSLLLHIASQLQPDQLVRTEATSKTWRSFIRTNPMLNARYERYLVGKANSLQPPHGELEVTVEQPGDPNTFSSFRVCLSTALQYQARYGPSRFFNKRADPLLDFMQKHPSLPLQLKLRYEGSPFRRIGENDYDIAPFSKVFDIIKTSNRFAGLVINTDQAPFPQTTLRELCTALQVHRSCKRLALQHVDDQGLSTLASYCTWLETLELPRHRLTDASGAVLCFMMNGCACSLKLRIGGMQSATVERLIAAAQEGDRDVKLTLEASATDAQMLSEVDRRLMKNVVWVEHVTHVGHVDQVEGAQGVRDLVSSLHNKSRVQILLR